MAEVDYTIDYTIRFRRDGRMGQLVQNPPEDREKCWPWTGPLRPNGYPQTVSVPLVVGCLLGSVETSPHRVTYAVLRGPIPEGLTLDHLCRNPSCVNPWHLEPVTTSENLRRRWEGNRGGVRQLPSGRWQARITVDGRRTPAPSTFETREAAETWMSEAV